MTPTRSTLLTALLLAFSFGATAAPLSKVEYKTGKTEIAAKLKADKQACDAQTGNAKDICIEEAKGVEKVALAELEANYQPSTKHSYDISAAKAKAAYAVAKEKCDDQTGNAKDVCRKEAEAAHTTAMAEAKLAEKTTMNNGKAAEKITDAKTTAMDKNATAQKSANTDITNAEYKTATEKCDAFAGDVKAKCVAEAKTRFGK
jgi:hypothetical protein